MEMANIDSMEYWMQQLANKSETTKYHYKRYLEMFCEWIGKTPNELIEMQKKAKESKGDPRENQVLEGKVRAFLSYMEEKGFAIGTQKFAYAGILSFFENNLFPLNMRPQDRPSGDAEGSMIPKKDDILKMLNAALSQGYRAAILFLKDSGLRVSDVVRLKWTDAEDMGEGFWAFEILTRKRKVRATTFVGPETTDILKMMEQKDERIFPITHKCLSNAISRICRRANLKGISAHGLRKFFNVELDAARVSKERRFAMMGKKRGAYDENRKTELFETYRGAYDNLRIFGAVSVEVEKMKQNMERLREENLDLKTRLAKIDGILDSVLRQMERMDEKMRSVEEVKREMAWAKKIERRAKKELKELEKSEQKG